MKMGWFSKIFGTDAVIEKGVELIDKAFYTDEEKAQDKQKVIEMKMKHKLELLNAYQPYKLAQRYIAFGFVFVFLFIMLNGVVAQLYGLLNIQNVKNALQFANEMYLGEIVMIIVTFYFGGGAAEGIISKFKSKTGV